MAGSFPKEVLRKSSIFTNQKSDRLVRLVVGMVALG
jgi:hypothetical protein